MKSKVNKFICFANEKKGIEMTFNWMFAFIAGTAILLLAIYGMSKIIQIGENIGQSETAVALTALLNPLESGLASEKTRDIKLNKDSRIYFTCSYLDNKPFGKQTLSVSEKNLNNQYSEKGEEISIKNKYIFAEDFIEGKNIYVFSKPFFFPFKVGDLIIITTKDYCFYQAPNKIKDEIENLNLGNLKITDNLKNCTGIRVCFESERQDCQIKVFGENTDYEYGKVIKNLQEVKYKGSLIYGAIFSSKEIYECNLKRLMNKLSELTSIYYSKAEILEKSSCGSEIKADLIALKNSALGFNSSKDLIDSDESVKNVEVFNKALMQGCKLY